MHIIPRMVKLIKNLDVDVVHIPLGCTPYCQPIDISIDKPLKDGFRSRWEEWMLKSNKFEDGIRQGIREQVAG